MGLCLYESRFKKVLKKKIFKSAERSEESAATQVRAGGG